MQTFKRCQLIPVWARLIRDGVFSAFSLFDLDVLVYSNIQRD